jgi:hypothetical protein
MKAINTPEILPRLTVEPNANGSVDVSYMHIGSLKNLILPDHVAGTFNCAGNGLVDLVGCPKRIGQNLSCTNNPIVSLHGINEIVHSAAQIFLPDAVKSSILGLLLIDGLKAVYVSKFNSPPQLGKALFIVNQHLGSRDLLACQEELIDAGLEEFAQL